jgi:hypothetical protein
MSGETVWDLRQSVCVSAEGYRYPMINFDADMMLAILNNHEPFYWGA